MDDAQARDFGGSYGGKLQARKWLAARTSAPRRLAPERADLGDALAAAGRQRLVSLARLRPLYRFVRGVNGDD